jgi:ACR3 family arsenite efflux pump ArsB
MCINKLIPKDDKLKHYFLWSMAFIVGAIVLTPVFHNIGHFTGSVIAYIITVLTAGYKELIQDWLRKKGNPEWLDFLFSVLSPTLIMAMLYVLFIHKGCF